MSEGAGFLAALQLADGALPIGRFVHAAGLELVLRDEPHLSEDHLVELVQSHLALSAGSLDGVFVAEAHRRAVGHGRGDRDLAELVHLDRELTARKTSPGSRLASVSCGRRLAALGPTLASGGTIAAYALEVAAGRSDGNLAVASGVVAAGLGVSCRHAVLLELRCAVAGLLSAAVRLGHLPTSRSQVLLAAAAGSIGAAATAAMATPWEEASSSSIELEVAMLRRGRSTGWTFAS